MTKRIGEPALAMYAPGRLVIAHLIAVSIGAGLYSFIDE